MKRNLPGFLVSSGIFLLLCLVIYFHYSGSGIKVFGTLVFNFLILTLLTDGVFLLLHLPRSHVKHKRLSFDPKKVTVLIACYNGEEVIAKTIKEALTHFPKDQVVVISDASTDKTVEICRKLGVRVYQNKRNLNKGLSISAGIKHVKTPYVLILDDDTSISKTFIPTSLLEEGYSAVAFNVMPVCTGSFINKLQSFEYRRSMFLGKGIRARFGAVGNVSGAIGLFRTKDIKFQTKLHSGQYGGEDQQRTAFVQLYSKGKGVTYTDSVVYTKSPDNLIKFIRQRAFRWNMSLPELFILNVRILFTPRMHYFLKAEKAYKIYLLITDPIKVLYLLSFIFYPVLLTSYFYYLLFSFLIWYKVGKKDPILVVIFYPVFTLLRSLCRFVAELNWFRVKIKYVFTHKYHRLVPGRYLLYEYITVAVIGLFVWSASLLVVVKDPNNSYKKIAILTQKLLSQITLGGTIKLAGR